MNSAGSRRECVTPSSSPRPPHPPHQSHTMRSIAFSWWSRANCMACHIPMSYSTRLQLTLSRDACRAQGQSVFLAGYGVLNRSGVPCSVPPSCGLMDACRLHFCCLLLFAKCLKLCVCVHFCPHSKIHTLEGVVKFCYASPCITTDNRRPRHRCFGLIVWP